MKSIFEHAKEQLNPVLQPCPFCGGKAFVIDFHGPFQEYGNYIQCDACGGRTRKFSYVPYRLFITECQMVCTSVILAANAWNRKPGDTGTSACPDCGVSIPHTHREKDKFGTIIVDISIS